MTSRPASPPNLVRPLNLDQHLLQFESPFGSSVGTSEDSVDNVLHSNPPHWPNRAVRLRGIRVLYRHPQPPAIRRDEQESSKVLWRSRASTPQDTNHSSQRCCLRKFKSPTSGAADHAILTAHLRSWLPSLQPSR